MNRRQSLFALAAAAPTAVVAVAHAAGGDASTDVDPRVIEVQNLPVPISRDHRLLNYLFVTLRVELTDRGAQWSIRERSHFLRDSLLRTTHRVDLAAPESTITLNRQAAMTAFAAAAEEALGAGTVRGIQITAESSLRRR